MVTGRFAALLGAAARRISNVPWREFSSAAADCAFSFAKTYCAVHVFNNHVCGPVFVYGPSMLPTFNLTGDIVLVDRFSARWGSIGVGDIVCFRSPDNPQKSMIKRVVGLEGDAVTFLVDPARDERSKTIVVPKGHVWVQGDNIYNSQDSRHYGPVPRGLIHERAFCRFARGFHLIGTGFGARLFLGSPSAFAEWEQQVMSNDPATGY